MPFDSSGVFNRVIPGGWKADAQAGIKIRADRHDDEDDGFATGLSTCVTKDGRTQPTANLPMNGKRHTNVGEPVDPFDGATKKYVDDRFGAAFSITGIDDAGRINFTGSQSPLATGKPLGIGFTQADLFFGVKPLDVESVGKKPRWVWNDKGDGMGADVMSLTDTGLLTLNGVSPVVAIRPTSGNGLVQWLAADGTTQRMVLYTSSGAQGPGHLTVGAQTFTFKSGSLDVPQLLSGGLVYAGGGTAHLAADGNVAGSIWSAWGAGNAFYAINARIEARASAHAIAQASARFSASRMAGAVDYTHPGTGSALIEYPGYVVTGTQKSGSGSVYVFRYRQPQLYSDTAGWVTAFSF